MDNFYNISSDNSCKFSLDAYNGGTLYNSFHEDTLRNFYAYNATWTDFQTAANTIGHDDFEFEITFKNNVAISSSYVWLFYHNSQGGTTNIAYNYDLTSLFLGYNLYADDGSQIYCGSVLKSSILSSGVDIVSAGAVHTWKIGKNGTNVYVKINDITVFSTYHSSYATGNFKSNNTPASQFNGNILSAKLTNLTSNIIVWQATKTQLYNQDGIFPRTALRNFSVNSYTWNDFVNPQQNIGLDDVELELNIYWNYEGIPATSINIFAGTAATNAFYITAYINGAVYLYTNLIGPPYAGILIRPIGSPLEVGYHKITGRVIGTQLVGYVDDETPKTYTTARQTGLTFTAPTSNFNGNILSAKLTNLTSNTVLWQAREDQLFLPYGVYPSATPRNFATENATFNDLGRLSNIGYDDFEYYVEFLLNSITAGKQIIYRVAVPRLGIYISNTTLIQVINYCVQGAPIYYYNNPPIEQWIKCKIQRINGFAKFFINDIEVHSVQSSYNQISTTDLFTADADCYIKNAYFKNLTTDKVVWNFPNFEEGKRLITKRNVFTEYGYFEGANKTGTISNGNIWNIKTAYNLMNQPLRSTYYCRANFASMTDTSTAMQWGFSTGNNLRAFYIQLASGVYTINFSLVAKMTVQESVQIPHAIAVTLLDKFVDYVITVDDVARVISIYADGVFIASKTFASNNLGFYQNADYPIYIGSTVTGSCRADLSKIEKFAYFNRVFSEGEIRAFTYNTDTVLDIDITTTANNEEVYLSETTTSLTSDLIVNWGDGTIERIVRNTTNYTKISHIYTTVGNYKITASGKISIFYDGSAASKSAWRMINKIDYTKMGLTSALNVLRAINLTSINTPIIFPNYIQNFTSAFYQLGCDLPVGSKLSSSAPVAFQLFTGSKITRIRNGFTFGSIQPTGSSFAYICMNCTSLIEVEDGVKYPASLTASATNQTMQHYNGCSNLIHLSVNLFDDLNMDNLVLNAFSAFIRNCKKLKNLPNNFRLSAGITDLDYFAENSAELVLDVTDKFPLFTSGATIKMRESFSGCVKITGYLDPLKLWKRTDITWSVYNTFYGCILLTNYDEIPASWGGLATVSISTNRTWTDVWVDKTVNITSTGTLTCTDNKGVINLSNGSVLNITTNTGTINYVSGSIINGIIKTESGTLTGTL